MKLESRGVVAFTLVELLVVVSLIALLALCLVPALARSRPESGSFQCLNNQRQLARAWRMYADDNNDRFLGTVSGVNTVLNDPRGPWIQGWMTWSNEPDNTNLWLLTDPRYASIANYCGRDARLFKCPADRFVSGQQRSRGWTARVRSVAGNICVGGIDTYGLIESPYIVARKWSELLNPKPAETWLFMDEHPDSINDGAMYAPRLGEWIDIPANYHDGGGSIAYADGAAEIHRWQSSLRSLRVNFLFSSLPVPSNDPDLLWVRARTPKRPGFN